MSDVPNPRRGSWFVDNWISLLSLGVAFFAAFFTAASWYTSNKEYRNTISFTEQAYKGAFNDAGDLILRANQPALHVERVVIQPKFYIRDSFTTDDTLGQAVEFRDPEVTLDNSEGFVQATVYGAVDSVCNDNEANLDRCNAKLPITQYYVEIWFGGSENHSFWVERKS